MSSHVVVIDSTARRATVKTSPSKHMADVLQEACAKLGLDASSYGLKHKGKQLDLSLAFRLTGLSSGAKLELVQLSRSPAIVTVALQLPESEAQGTPNGRLLDKFPSSTTLWLVLRKFEAGVAGNGRTRNLTARGAPATLNGDSGSGRLFYESPVIHVMGRELSSFTDLQKTLAQLGFNSGNILLRLSFRRTDEPLEQAMVKIGEYFKSVETPLDESQAPSTSTAQEAMPPAASAMTEPLQPLPDIQSQVRADAETRFDTDGTTCNAPPPTLEQHVMPTVASRPVTVFSPPTAATPLSTQTAFNETDYVPSIEHAQAHQRRLNQASRPQRLPTDAEIAAKAAAEQEKLAAIREVDVKVRFPDQSQVLAKFGQNDTGQSLYEFVRSCLVTPFASEKFVITYIPSVGGGGPPATLLPGGRKIQTVIPDNDSTFLIRDLGMFGRVLVNFSWDGAASPAARESQGNLLRPELRSQAQELKAAPVPDVVGEEAREGSSGRAGIPGQVLDGRGAEERAGPRKGGSMPKWLKLPGKK